MPKLECPRPFHTRANSHVGVNNHTVVGLYPIESTVIAEKFHVLEIVLDKRTEFHTLARLGHQNTIDRVVLTRVPNIRIDCVILVDPRHALVDRIAIHGQPLTELAKTLLKNGRDRALFGRAHIDEHVAAAAHCLDHGWDDIVDGQVLVDFGIATVAPRRRVDREAVFPFVVLKFARVISIVTCIVAAVMTRHTIVAPSFKLN